MKETMVHSLCESFKKHADDTAIVGYNESLAYSDLEARTNALANKILGTTHGEKGFIVLLLPRRSNFIVAAIAVQKAGCAYIPISLEYPAERINYIIKDSQAKMIIATDKVLKNIHEKGGFDANNIPVELLNNFDWSKNADKAVDNSEPDDPAVMLYTSGTTGTPKGILYQSKSLRDITHRWVNPENNPEIDKINSAVMVDFTFVVSVNELYGPLHHGGCVHILSEAIRTDMEKINDYINTHKINHMFLPSSLGVAMLTQYKLGLKELIMGGEKVVGLTPEILKDNCKAFNHYGMSEAQCTFPRPIAGTETNIPIGKPYPGVEIFIVNENGEQVKPGEIGELCFCSNDYLSFGYYHLEQLTAEKYVECPFKPGYRMFRTGDLMCQNADGEYVHCGRSDNLIKLRGLRIETGEVENVAQDMPEITLAVCALKKVNGEDQLCLYYEAGTELVPEAIEAHLKKRLAEYMIPALYIHVDKLPRNARGKIDRKALPDPVINIHTEMVPPENESEQKLFSIISKILGHENFGVTDDLKAIGMSSLQCIRFAAEATAKGFSLRPSDILRHRTIRKILTAHVSMAYWIDGKNDPSKPLLVLVSGVIMTDIILGRCETWKEKFSIFVIEPIQDDYEIIFNGETMHDIIGFYATLLEINNIRPSDIFAIAGESLGGIFAYRLAHEIYEESGYTPNVYMLDALVAENEDRVNALRNGTLKEYYESKGIKNYVLDQKLIDILLFVDGIKKTAPIPPSYPGKVRLLSGTITDVPGLNESVWQKYAKNITITQVADEHVNLCLNPEQTHFFTEVLYADL